VPLNKTWRCLSCLGDNREKDRDYKRQIYTRTRKRRKWNHFKSKRQPTININAMVINEGWTEFQDVPQVTMMGHLCILSGLLIKKEGVIDVGTHCATLPQNCWPYESQCFPGIMVSKDGRIFSTSNNDIISLCGINILLN